MCICVNCQWVEKCKAYHAVETQHGVEHLSLNPDFEPDGPVIHISLIGVKQGNTEIEWDVQRCKSFCCDNGRWSRLRPNEKVPT